MTCTASCHSVNAKTQPVSNSLFVHVLEVVKCSLTLVLRDISDDIASPFLGGRNSDGSDSMGRIHHSLPCKNLPNPNNIRWDPLPPFFSCSSPPSTCSPGWTGWRRGTRPAGSWTATGRLCTRRFTGRSARSPHFWVELD